MNICSFNALEKKEALELLIPCGQSAVWARNVAALRPFTSFDELRTNAALEWQALPEEEQSKALALHPLIGDVEMLKEKFSDGHKNRLAKSADEMLQILNLRINNATADEFANAAAEHQRITQSRLQDIFDES